MLLLNSSWWERLSDQDHQLLHELPGPHGELVAWLERFLVNQGTGPWSALEAALAEDGMLETARGLAGGLYAQEDALFEDFQQVLRKLWITRLEAESMALAASNPQGAELERFRELRARIQALKTPAPA
jgi:DNA primase